MFQDERNIYSVNGVIYVLVIDKQTNHCENLPALFRGDFILSSDDYMVTYGRNILWSEDVWQIQFYSKAKYFKQFENQKFWREKLLKVDVLGGDGLVCLQDKTFMFKIPNID